MRRFEINTAAIREARRARAWYAHRSVEASERFIAALKTTINAVISRPERGQRYEYGYRRRRLTRFPYLLVYDFDETTVWVVAVAHTSRRTAYWRRRSGWRP